VQTAEISYSVFCLVPLGTEKIVVRDKPDEKQIKTGFFQKLKFPGGRVESGETLEEAAKGEVIEETHQRVIVASRILEIHKNSTENRAPHHVIFFETKPPLLEHALEAGEEIEEIMQLTGTEITEKINSGEFFPSHAAAYEWSVVREEYLKLSAGDEETDQKKALELIAPFLTQRSLHSWFVEDGVLVLCYDPACEICERETKKITTPPILLLPEEKKSNLDGKINFVILFPGRWEDCVLLPRVGERQRNSLPAEEFNGVSIEEAVKIVAEKEGCELHCIGYKELRGGEKIIIAQSDGGETKTLSLVILNETPPSNLQMFPADWEAIWRGVEHYNRVTQEKIMIHLGWREQVPRPRKPSYRKNRRQRLPEED